MYYGTQLDGRVFMGGVQRTLPHTTDFCGQMPPPPPDFQKNERKMEKEEKI